MSVDGQSGFLIGLFGKDFTHLIQFRCSCLTFMCCVNVLHYLRCWHG